MAMAAAEARLAKRMDATAERRACLIPKKVVLRW
jgi:hypothetical protein